MIAVSEPEWRIADRDTTRIVAYLSAFREIDVLGDRPILLPLADANAAAHRAPQKGDRRAECSNLRRRVHAAPGRETPQALLTRTAGSLRLKPAR